MYLLVYSLDPESHVTGLINQGWSRTTDPPAFTFQEKGSQVHTTTPGWHITLEEDYFSKHEVELSLSLLSPHLQEGHIFYWICDFVLGPRCTTFAGSPGSTADSMNGKAKNSLRYFSFFTSVGSILNQLLIKNVHVLTCIWVKLSYINPTSSHH